MARIRRTAVVIAGAATAVLALPALAGAAANPMTFDYSNSTDIQAYAKPTGAVVVGRSFLNPGVVDRVQAGGGEVYQYINLVEGYFDDQNATGDQAALYGGAKTNPAYLRKPTLYNYPRLPMTDMRPGSPWILHAVDHVRRWFPTTHAKGLFLDVMGDRLYTSAWDAMSSSERAQWTAGNRDLIHRLRAALGPNVILVANNIWENGNPDLNGITIEHHPYGDHPRWASQLQRSDWFKPVRNMVIGNSTSEALQWANRPGVTHVTSQSSYGGPAAPIIGFTGLPGVSGVVSGAVPATPPATPAAATPGPVAAPAAKRIQVILRGNLLKNSSFERVVSPWGTTRATVRTRAAKRAPQGRRIAQVSYTGGNATYALTRAASTSVEADTGGRYRARAWVRAGSANTVGKPVTLYLRERTASGGVLQEIRGRTVKLTKGFFPLNSSIVPKVRGNRIELAIVQDRARSGNSFQVDAVSVASAR